ncbi:ABC transporter substrate-binding protein [Bradyrhizobium manausense]|uniref:ABC transporter substrate-binding protein n=1 Tax=Bradyrhizobium manausense TaxID=989370 RepID=UPI001BA534A1|nr:ABC transporter substrate-binding protein [Bradyrhizobium manausense]MBR1086656.1 ABC transporter substrate-binding protein [Bradyrhizobium manausense]
MRRRDFIAGALAAAYPVVAGAQQANRLPTVGFLIPGSEQSHGRWVAAFTKRMGELGWIDGQTVRLEYRWAAGHPERYPGFAAEFVQLNASVLVTSINDGVVVLKQAAPETPIVHTAMVAASPFISSLSHPGGRVTGLSQIGQELGGKRLQLLIDAVPQLRHVAVLGVASDVKRVPETEQVTAAGQLHGIEVLPLTVTKLDDVAQAISSVKDKVEALYVIIHPFVSVNQIAINALALEARLPTMHGLPEHVRSGGLMSYGPSFEDLFARAGNYVDKILRGANPADLPVEQPVKFDLVINLKTAATLGLTFPPALLTTADEVIE